MPFRAEIELKTRDARALWTKAINSFYTISDSFKIVIRQGEDSGVDQYGRKCFSELLFVTMNKTKTAILNTSFKTTFFKKFTIEGEIEDVVRDRNNASGSGMDNYNYARSYTFVVNSRDMNVLFKDCGEDAISWKIFLLASGETTHMIYSNRLFVEFDTKSGMKKKYTISYRPSFNGFDSEIHYTYLKTLGDQKISDEKQLRLRLDNGGGEMDDNDGDDFDDDFDDDDFNDERVHRIAVDSVILKSFLQTFPVQLEDFQIEVEPTVGLITFKGYNRQQHTIRSTNLVNRPMTLDIKMRLDQIVYNNFKVYNDGDDTNEKDKLKKSKKIQASFRLKNFKTFIQIISGNLSEFLENDENDDDTNNRKNYRSLSKYGDKSMHFDNGENICDIIFSKPGYPIVFERRYFIDNGELQDNDCCSVTLTEITDGESSKLTLHTKNSSINNITNNQINAMNQRFTRRLIDSERDFSLSRGVTATINDNNSNGDNNLNMNRFERDDGINEPLFVAEEAEFYDDNNVNDNYQEENDTHSKAKRRKLLSDDNSENREDFEQIFWLNSKFHQTKVVEKNHVSDKSDSNKVTEERENEAEKENINENKTENDDEYLGPTQRVLIKGLFD